MITITLKKIKKHSPCKEGWKRVVEANGGIHTNFDKEFPVSSILDSNDLDDTLWVLKCLPEYDSLWRKFAWWCASKIAHNTNDKQVSKCLEVVWRYSEGLATDDELIAARSAATAASWAAARSAATATAAAAENKLRNILDSGEWS